MDCRAALPGSAAAAEIGPSRATINASRRSRACDVASQHELHALALCAENSGDAERVQYAVAMWADIGKINS